MLTMQVYEPALVLTVLALLTAQTMFLALRFSRRPR